MPRSLRVFVEGGIYHVYNRAASGEEIFSDPETAISFLDLVREIKERDGWTVFAWALMSNHYHFVVRTSSVPLSRGMHSIQSSFGHRFNRRFGRTGGTYSSPIHLAPLRNCCAVPASWYCRLQWRTLHTHRAGKATLPPWRPCSRSSARQPFGG